MVIGTKRSVHLSLQTDISPHNIIVVRASQITLDMLDGALNNKGTHVRTRRFIADIDGLTADIKKKQTSDIIALSESQKRATKGQRQVWDKEYKPHRMAIYAA